MGILRQKHSGTRQTLLQHTHEKSQHIVTFSIIFSVQHSAVRVLHQALYWYVPNISVNARVHAQTSVCAHILQFLCVSVCVLTNASMLVPLKSSRRTN